MYTVASAAALATTRAAMESNTAYRCSMHSHYDIASTVCVSHRVRARTSPGLDRERSRCPVAAYSRSRTTTGSPSAQVALVVCFPFDLSSQAHAVAPPRPTGCGLSPRRRARMPAGPARCSVRAPCQATRSGAPWTAATLCSAANVSGAERRGCECQPRCRASGAGGGRWQVAHLVRGRDG